MSREPAHCTSKLAERDSLQEEEEGERAVLRCGVGVSVASPVDTGWERMVMIAAMVSVWIGRQCLVGGREDRRCADDGGGPDAG
ncbi:hypothetical protein CVT26_009969 [Gymnopilus dilepis]|uniref:Uncharacterized protein n=1 Tax=Gymnopilus dilepis TaxID=231916 RepID=A0A409VL99_9AGAR|nr:hypothetical protein CVT26_009969 [Gymnopilus dilepis]